MGFSGGGGIAPGSVTNAMLADGAVDARTILDGSVATAELAAAAVTSVKTSNGFIISRNRISASLMQTTRVAVNPGAGAIVDVVANWGTTFADTNYTVAWAIQNTDANNDLRVLDMTVQATDHVSIRVQNLGGVAEAGVLHVFAFHD